MTQGYRELIGLQTAFATDWMRAVIAVIKCYAALLDPRPDLAVPARQIRAAYRWWW